MTRFWLSPSQAVELVRYALMIDSGTILIPKMPALSIGRLAEYTLGNDFEFERVPLRPGEKMHEELLTIEETAYATESQDFFFLRPTTAEKVEHPPLPYSSDIAPELTRDELMELLKD
jgi:UDP-N-acetylglucosamine 4,6-dehydratase